MSNTSPSCVKFLHDSYSENYWAEKSSDFWIIFKNERTVCKRVTVKVLSEQLRYVCGIRKLSVSPYECYYPRTYWAITHDAVRYNRVIKHRSVVVTSHYCYEPELSCAESTPTCIITHFIRVSNVWMRNHQHVGLAKVNLLLISQGYYQ